MNIAMNRPLQRVHPKKFALWIALASITMMFGAFTSAYLVKQAAGNWLEYRMPSIFYVSTAILLLSSIVLHMSYKSFVRANFKVYKALLTTGFVLGFTFVILQYLGWQDLFSKGIDLKGNVSGSFFYLISGVHALHIIGGLAALCVALLHAFSLKEKVTETRKLRFELTLNYWHFMDILWLYLFVFLLMSR